MPHRPIWFCDAPERPSLPGSASADLCVVGLGGSGLAAVRAGLAAGMRVIGIDAERIARGAAGRNGGFLLAGPAWFHHDARQRVGRELAASLYHCTRRELERMDGRTGVRLAGSLRVAASADEHADIDAHLVALHEDEIPAERYTGPEGTGILVPGDGVFDPYAYCLEDAAAAESAGAALYERSEALAIDAGRVRTAAGEVRASRIVIAVDGALPSLVPALADSVTTWRLQMLASAPIARRVSPYAVYSRYGYDYWQQLPDGAIALGGGRDVGGDADRDAALGVSEPVQSHLERVLREQIGVDAPIARRWSGRISYTTDGLPVCAELGEGCVAIGAYCGTGNVIGRMMGREVVERFDGGRAPYLEALDAARACLDAREPS